MWENLKAKGVSEIQIQIFVKAMRTKNIKYQEYIEECLKSLNSFKRKDGNYFRAEARQMCPNKSLSEKNFWISPDKMIRAISRTDQAGDKEQTGPLIARMPD